jgi:hypothetical protein
MGYGLVDAIAGGRGKPRRVFAAATSGDVSLPEREMDNAPPKKQKQIKRAPDKMRFQLGINLFFHKSDSGAEQCVSFFMTKAMGAAVAWGATLGLAQFLVSVLRLLSG